MVSSEGNRNFSPFRSNILLPSSGQDVNIAVCIKLDGTDTDSKALGC